MSETPPAPQTKHPSNSYLQYGNAVRVLATIAVVFIHTRGIMLEYGILQPDTLGGWFAMTVNAASRWCVPAFFMLSGAILLNPTREEPWTKFYRMRLNRIGIPLVFWSAFYILGQAGTRSSGLSLADSATKVWHGRPIIPMWFIYAMLCMYIVTPMLRAWIRWAGQKQKWLVAVALLGGSGALAVMWTFSKSTNWALPPEPTIATEWIFYLGYFILGYLLRNIRLTRRQAILAAVILVAVTTASMAGRMWMASSMTGKLWMAAGDPLTRIANNTIETAFDCYLSPAVILSAIPAFLLIATLFADGGPKATRWLTSDAMSNATFGVYLIHIAVLDTIAREAMHHVGGSLPAYIGLGITTLVISFLLAAGIGHIPLIRKIIGH